MIPELTKKTIDLYIAKKQIPGGFVEACLANDFIRAIQAADCTNGSRLKDIVHYILEFVPPEAKGSYEKVDKWIGDIK